MKKFTSIKIMIVSICVLYGLTAMAQYPIPSKAHVDKLLSRTIAIEILDETNEDNKALNEVIKDAFDKYWKLTPVEYLNAQQYEDALQSTDGKYAIFSGFSNSSTQSVKRHSPSFQRNFDPVGSAGAGYSVYSYASKPGDGSVAKTFYFGYYELGIMLVEGPGKRTKVLSAVFANEILYPYDYAFAVKQFTIQAEAASKSLTGPEYFNVKNNIEHIKGRTLLVPKELLREKDLEKLDEAYEYPYQLVTMEEMSNLVLSADDKYIYPRIIFSPVHNFFGWVTIGASDGRVLSTIIFGGIKIKSEQKANDIIKVGNFKHITSEFAQNINNKFKK